MEVRSDRPVVVGVDGSDGSLTALDWAAAEAERTSRVLRIVHASEWGRRESYRARTAAEDRPADAAPRGAVVTDAMARVHRRAPGVRVAAASVPGEPSAVLVSESDDAVVLVVGSRGRGPISGMLLGSVSLAVAARARCPVAVARQRTAAGTAADAPVVLGIGATAADDPAVLFAHEQARARRVPLLAVRAWRPPVPDVVIGHGEVSYDPVEVERASRQRANECVEHVRRLIAEDRSAAPVRFRAVEGPAHEVLLRAAEGAAVLVVGAGHRGSRVPGLQLGRVNHAVLHHAACPVVVVPGTE